MHSIIQNGINLNINKKSGLKNLIEFTNYFEEKETKSAFMIGQENVGKSYILR